MRKISFLALFLAFLMVSTGAFAGEANDPVVIKAGECTVLLSEAQAYFDSLYSQYSTYYTSYGQNMPPEEVLQIRDNTISELSLFALLDNKVSEYGLGDVSDEQKQALWEESNALYEENLQQYADNLGVSIEEMRAELTAAGITPELQFDNMLEMLPYTRLYDYIARNVTVDDNMIKRAYDTYVQQDKELYANDIVQYEMNANFSGTQIMYKPEGYRAVNHILLAIPEDLAITISNIQDELLSLKDEIDALNEELQSLSNSGQQPLRTANEINQEIAQKQQEYDILNADFQTVKQDIVPQMQGVLDDINSKLLAGESFGALVSQYGRDENFQLQDDGYYHVHKQSILFNDAFRDAAMALTNMGDLSAPIITDHGIYIIQYVKDVPGGALPLTDEITELLRKSLLEDAKYTYYNDTLAQWQSQIPIETHPELIVMPNMDTLPMETTPEGTVSNPVEADGSIG